MSKARTKVKVCGMTREQDVQGVVELGADAVGVILHANSPRLIEVEQAMQLRKLIPAFVSMVGVFVNADTEFINEAATRIDLDLIQLHGEETNDFGLQLNRPFIKAIRVHSKEQINQQIGDFGHARALLLDPYVKNQHGGTGQQLDFSLWPQSSPKKLILAGGISPDNIADATQTLHPYAVDLNSGVESSPGVKDLNKVKQALSVLLA